MFSVKTVNTRITMFHRTKMIITATEHIKGFVLKQMGSVNGERNTKMNSVHISGRLTADPEVRYSQDGLPIANFTVAVDRGKDKGADFIRVKAFSKTAQLVEKYTAKGKRVIVEGSIHTGSYDKNGEKVFFTDVNAFKVEFLDWKGNGSENEYLKPETGQNNFSLSFEAVEDEDLPF